MDGTTGGGAGYEVWLAVPAPEPCAASASGPSRTEVTAVLTVRMNNPKHRIDKVKSGMR